VQALLDSEFSDWGVMIQLEINDSSESIPPEGLIVYADSVEEAWNAEQLARVFGKKFVFRFSAERIATEHANTTLASVPSPLAPRAGSLQDRNMMVP
jgi:hypothetical protein